MLQKRHNKELKKHVAAIHSSSKLTLVQRKIANALLIHAYNNLLTQDEHTIHIEELTSLIGYNSKDFNLIKKSLKALLSTVIEWNLVDKDSLENSDIWNASSIISDASIQGATCSYSYSNRMRQLLYHPDVYGKIDMNLIASFKSTYGIALYENIVRYQSIKQTPWLKLDVFRKLMGVEDGKYPIFRDFKRRIIDKALNEINEITDFDVCLEQKKIDRKVIEIKFKISAKKACLDIKAVSSDSFIRKLISDYGISATGVDELISEFGRDKILSKIKMIEGSRSYKDGSIKNLAKYLKNALVKDYQPPKSSKTIIEKKKNQEVQKQQVSKEYLDYVKKAIITEYEKLDEKSKNKLISGFEGYISQGLYHNLFVKDGMNNPLVVDQFYAYIKGIKHKLLDSIQSLSDFSAKNVCESE